MQVKFNKVIIEGFQSIGHIELDLCDRGFTIVSGINNCKDDNAKNNGSGKCFGRGTKIMMSDGTVKNAEDIVVGDFVMGWDSTPRMVLECHKGVGKLYRVSGLSKNRTDYSYVCNEEHLLCLRRTCGVKRGAPELSISIPEFQNLPCHLQAEYNQYIVPIVKFNVEQKQLKLNPYWLGVWLGDGTSNKPQITTMDDEIVETCYDIAKYYGLKVVSYKNRKRNLSTSYSMTCSSRKCGYNGFVNDLRSIGVFGNKHIPQEYLIASYEDRMSLLCGLLDTDGGREDYSISITQERETLAKQIAFLARSLGFKTTITKKFVKKYNKDYFRVSIYGETWKIPLRVKHKIIEEHYAQRPHTLGTHIEDAGVGEYFGFQIEGDGKFLLSDCTVVHNSTTFNAIVYALVGETIQGVSKNLVNINTNTGLMVDLFFQADGVNYEILRTREHHKYGTSLKLFENGGDVSGKGIRDTEKIISERLPDLTSELLGSVIIIGQGMPQKFTGNTPSGRKEVLEKLSKSDFMIEDIKSRLSTRKNILTFEIRDFDMKINELQGKLSVYNKNLEMYNQQLNGLVIPDQSKIEEAEAKRVRAREKLDELNDEAHRITDELYSVREEQSSIREKQFAQEKSIEKEYSDKISSMQEKKYSLQAKIKSLSDEIKRLDSVVDICPTCGQKLPDVHKVDTSEKKDELSKLQDSLNSICGEISLCVSERDEKKSSEVSKYASLLIGAKNKENELNTRLSRIKPTIVDYQKEETYQIGVVTELKSAQASYEQRKSELNEQITFTKNAIEKINDDMLYNNMGRDDTNSRLDAVNKMLTIATRDFRGVLLTNVIEFINKRAKSYCMDIFNTDKVLICLDGNNLNVAYNDKMYENLSGGEQKKVDIILQLSIRDMLCQFSSFSSNILVLDETFEALDYVGCQKVIDVITKRLSDIESVFIITHRSNLSLPADNTITIIKDESGVSNLA